MLRHEVETCDDDLTALQTRLDSLTDAGSRIISVVWQARRVVEDDQSAAYDARGSFVIVSEHDDANVLRDRVVPGEAFEEVYEGGRA